jgi:DNA-3-methyladenine glycosylase
MSPRVLPLRFFQRPAEEVARDLLGAILVSRAGGATVSGIITETEAYLGYDDPASHAYLGRRHRQNEHLYSPPGTWYVYRSYGVHCCANLVAAPNGRGAAVLLRGLFPMEGVSVMRRRRGRTDALADGPGKLCQALRINRDLDGLPMHESSVVVLPGTQPATDAVRVTPRIGITKAVGRFGLCWLARPHGPEQAADQVQLFPGAPRPAESAVGIAGRTGHQPRSQRQRCGPKALRVAPPYPPHVGLVSQ